MTAPKNAPYPQTPPSPRKHCPCACPKPARNYLLALDAYPCLRCGGYISELRMVQECIRFAY